MRGCLFTLLLGAIVVAFVIVAGLPALAAGLVTAGLSTAGLVADDTTVTVTSDPPTDFLGLRADRVRITATDATFRGMEIGALDLALGDVRILDRLAGSVDGQLTAVTVTGPGGERITIDRITLLGGPDGLREGDLHDGVGHRVDGGVRRSRSAPPGLHPRAGLPLPRLDAMAGGPSGEDPLKRGHLRRPG